MREIIRIFGSVKFVGERWETTKANVEHNSQGPDIHRSSIFAMAGVLEYLRSNIYQASLVSSIISTCCRGTRLTARSTATRAELARVSKYNTERGHPQSCCEGLFADYLGEAKVRELDRQSLVGK